jgi:hypothetical protein
VGIRNRGIYCTKYEIRNTGLKLMSNAEPRFKNEEVGIRIGIGITTLTNFGEKCESLLCTWPACRQAGTWYFVQSCYFKKCRTPDADF